MSDALVRITCPKCSAGLRVPAVPTGKPIHCPSCRRVIPLPPPPAPPPPPPAAPTEPTPEAPAAEQRAALPEAPAALPEAPAVPVSEAPAAAGKPGRKTIPMSTGIAIAVIAACALGLYLAMRPAVVGDIPDEMWKTREAKGRFRVKLPGKVREEEMQDPITQRNVFMYTSTPDEASVFSVGFTEPAIPPGELAGQGERLLDAFGEGVPRDVEEHGGKELRRTKLTRPYPGREFVLRMPREGVQMVHRVYLIGGRVFFLSAAGPDMAPDHPNAVRLFQSFEPLTDTPKAGP